MDGMVAPFLLNNVSVPPSLPSPHFQAQRARPVRLSKQTNLNSVKVHTHENMTVTTTRRVVCS
jgi:hypothetical protein